ncbi:Kinesin-like calmodulin-binding protein [Diplonema papillatum]|nr:Kinesin-like calmodulin-binding protein [Diplonema papillatum]
MGCGASQAEREKEAQPPVPTIVVEGNHVLDTAYNNADEAQPKKKAWSGDNDEFTWTQGFVDWHGGRYHGGVQGKKLQGFGVHELKNGDAYTGEFSDNEMHGWGLYRYNNGDSYEGGWDAGSPHGTGVYTFKDYGTFIGQFERGYMQGFGTFRLLNNAGEYIGYWSHSLREGEGYCRTDTSIYDGTWRDGKESGWGVGSDASSVYYGPWLAGVKHGKGVVDKPSEVNTHEGEGSGEGGQGPPLAVKPAAAAALVRHFCTFENGLLTACHAVDSLRGKALLCGPDAELWRDMCVLAEKFAADGRRLSDYFSDPAEARRQQPPGAPPFAPTVEVAEEQRRVLEAARQARQSAVTRNSSTDLVKGIESLPDHDGAAAPGERPAAGNPLAFPSCHLTDSLRGLVAGLRGCCAELAAENGRLRQRADEALRRAAEAQPVQPAAPAAAAPGGGGGAAMRNRVRSVLDVPDPAKSKKSLIAGAFMLQLAGTERANAGSQRIKELEVQVKMLHTMAALKPKAKNDAEAGIEEADTMEARAAEELEKQITEERQRIELLQQKMAAMNHEHEEQMHQETALLRQKQKEADEAWLQIEHLKKVGGQEYNRKVAEFEDERARLQDEQTTLTEQMAEIQREKEELESNFREERTQARKLRNEIEDMKGKIRVYVRTRPLNKVELQQTGEATCLNFEDDTTVTAVGGPQGDKTFSFDRAFDASEGQETVFEDTKNLVQSAIDGYNVCVFAYGQTGSGKTYTLTGSESDPGIARRAIEEVFLATSANTAATTTVTCYMVELYLTDIYDLLAPRTGAEEKAPKLQVKKDKKGLVHIQGVNEVAVETHGQLYDLFVKGQENRHVRCTRMNGASSRSHLVFSIKIKSRLHADNSANLGKFTICDLAGSERLGKTELNDKESINEAKAINLSLTALGNVIGALSKKDKHVPYRDSKLTQVMSDSIGGNAKTLMFVNISPSPYNLDETIGSLNYAARVKLVTNHASKSVETDEVRRLKAKIAALQNGREDEDELDDV